MLKSCCAFTTYQANRQAFSPAKRVHKHSDTSIQQKKYIAACTGRTADHIPFLELDPLELFGDQRLA